MSSKLVAVGPLYENYLSSHYHRYPDHKRLPYEQQKTALLACSTGMGQILPYGPEHGFENIHLIPNARNLQKTWAVENKGADESDLLFSQIRAYSPDIVWFWDSLSVSASWLDRLRREVPSIRKTVGYCSFPYTIPMLRQFKNFDLLLSCASSYVAEFRAAGIDAHHLVHCFTPPELPCDSPATNRDTVLSFWGSLTRRHQRRQALLRSLLDADLPLQIHGEYTHFNTVQRMAALAASAFSNTVEMLSLDRRLKRARGFWRIWERRDYFRNRYVGQQLQRATRPPHYGEEMLMAMQRSLLCLNSHIDGIHTAANMRLFEATGMGCCLITEAFDDVAKYFELDDEIVTYSSPDECISKVKYLIDNPGVAIEIGQRAKSRVIRDHSADHRMGDLARILKGCL